MAARTSESPPQIRAAAPPPASPEAGDPAPAEPRLVVENTRARGGAYGVGEPKFLGFNALRGRSVHNFGIPIHNLWDKKIRNLWDSSIIYGTASQTSPCLAGRGSFRG